MVVSGGRGFYLGLGIGQVWLVLSSTAGVSFLGIYGSTATERELRYGLVAAGALLLLAAAGSLIRAARRLPPEGTSASASRRRRTGRSFGLVVLAEVVAIVAAVVGLVATGRWIWIVPFAALVVGLHFIPLAFVFRVRPYLALGVLWVAVVMAVVLAVPASSMAPAGLRQWVVLPFLGCGLSTWAVVVYILVWAHLRLRRVAPAVARPAGST